MKDFDDFLKETQFQRKAMIEKAAKKINESSQSPKGVSDSSYNTRISLSIFRSEMTLYHQWLMEQISQMNSPTESLGMNDNQGNDQNNTAEK